MITIKGVDPRMIANNIMPYEPVHPGELLKEEIEYRGISQRKLASQIGISYSALNDIINLKRQITSEIAVLIEAALGIEAEMLIKMQTSYNMQMTKSNKTLSERLVKIRNSAAFL